MESGTIADPKASIDLIGSIRLNSYGLSKTAAYDTGVVLTMGVQFPKDIITTSGLYTVYVDLPISYWISMLKVSAVSCQAKNATN